MPRRRVVAKREVLPDPKFHNVTLAKFMNHVMISGKKAVAERIVYGALDLVKENYQVPVEVRPSRRNALAMRWLVEYARGRGEKSMAQRLAGELIDASQSKGSAVKKREDVHRMAEANKAFSHFRF